MKYLFAALIMMGMSGCSENSVKYHNFIHGNAIEINGWFIHIHLP